MCVVHQKSLRRIGMIVKGSSPQSGCILGYISLWSTLFPPEKVKQICEFWIQPKLWTEDSCVGKWTILTDPAQAKSSFLLMTLLTIQRVGKAFARICPVCFFLKICDSIYKYPRKGNLLLFLNLLGLGGFFCVLLFLLLLLLLLLLLFLLPCFLFCFPSTKWKY